jgi:osmoprotectant transport system permease protein
VQVVATAPLAALVGGGTLGAIINNGFGNQNYGQVLAGGFLVAALALLVEAGFLLLQRAVTPGRGSTRQRRRPVAPVEAADAVPA